MESKNEELKTKLVDALTNKGTSFDGPAEVFAFRDITLLRGLYMECATGMKMSRGVNCYAIAKREYKLKGAKKRVFEQLAEIMKAKHGIDLTGLVAKLK